MMPDHVVLEAVNLHYSYGPHEPEVLRGIDLQLKKSTVTTLLGPNGSGKTTLLKLLLGWLVPSDGAIELEGKHLTEYSRRERGRLTAYVPQEEHITFEIDMLDYVLLGMAPYLDLLEMPGKDDYRSAKKVIEQLGLMGLVGRKVAELSGGEKQLASIARALVQKPQVFLFDEPLSHLDIRNSQRILRTLQQLKDMGKTILFTSHDPNTAAAVADSVILLRKGRLMADGGMKDVLTEENLSRTYDVPVEVIQTHGRIFIPFPLCKSEGKGISL